MDLINIINTALCVIILVLGYWGFTQKRMKAPLLIGIAFGFFGVSHIVKLIGLEPSLLNFMITIRVIAYVMVVFALWMFAAKD